MKPKNIKYKFLRRSDLQKTLAIYTVKDKNMILKPKKMTVKSTYFEVAALKEILLWCVNK